MQIACPLPPHSRGVGSERLVFAVTVFSCPDGVIRSVLRAFDLPFSGSVCPPLHLGAACGSLSYKW